MNRTVMIAIVVLVLIIWASALSNACSPAAGYAGGFWGPPVFVGGGWDRGGWDRTGGSSPAPSRSSGGSSTRGGGISGGTGGK